MTEQVSQRALLAGLTATMAATSAFAGKTRSPILSHSLGLSLEPSAPAQPSPLQVPVNRYPHSVCYSNGAIFLTSVGGNFGVSGNAKVEKFDALTATKLGETVVGPYETSPGSGVYVHGCSGVCVGGGSLWAAQSLGIGEVIRINPDTMAIEARITVGYLCRDVWWDGEKIWATVGSQNKIVRIDPATNAIDLTVDTAAVPFRGGFDGQHVWVACFAGSVVQKINRFTGSILASIATGGVAPNWLWCETDRIFVANYTSSSVACIDAVTNELLWVEGTSANSHPHGLILVDRELWICCSGDHFIRIYDVDARRWVRGIAVPQNPPGICFDGASIWHPCGNANVLLRHPIRTAW